MVPVSPGPSLAAALRGAMNAARKAQDKDRTLVLGTILANLRLQQFGGIDSLTLTLEKVSYTDQQQPANSLQLNLDVNSETVTNLQTEEALKTWLNAFLLRIAIQQGMQSPGTMGKFLHFH